MILGADEIIELGVLKFEYGQDGQIHYSRWVGGSFRPRPRARVRKPAAVRRRRSDRKLWSLRQGAVQAKPRPVLWQKATIRLWPLACRRSGAGAMLERSP
jgi:hypothetical protein